MKTNLSGVRFNRYSDETICGWPLFHNEQEVACLRRHGHEALHFFRLAAQRIVTATHLFGRR
jgi:hypothetical protein